MRPIWKGHISFGLVNVPVTLYPAEERTDLQLHMVDSRNHSRIRYERVNAETGEEVPWNQIVKAFEYSDGNYVVLSDAELKKASPEATKTVDIEAFVDVADIDPMYFDKPYYLEPGNGGKKGYVLLRETLNASGKAGIARVVIRTKQYLAAMMPRGNALVLNLMRFDIELRSIKGLDIPGSAAQVGVSKSELKMAETLVRTMSRAWKPSEYHDEFRDALKKWIGKKVKAGQVTSAPDLEEDDSEVPAPISIMDALKKSLDNTTEKPPARATTRSKRSAHKKAS